MNEQTELLREIRDELHQIKLILVLTAGPALEQSLPGSTGSSVARSTAGSGGVSAN